MKTRVIASVFLFLFAAPWLNAEKKPAWQTGTLLDTDRQRFYAGSVGGGSSQTSVYGSGNYGTTSTSTSSTAVYRTYQEYWIESDTHVYVAKQRLRI